MTIIQLELFKIPPPAALSLERRRRELAGFEAALQAMAYPPPLASALRALIDGARAKLNELEAEQTLQEAA